MRQDQLVPVYGFVCWPLMRLRWPSLPDLQTSSHMEQLRRRHPGGAGTTELTPPGCLQVQSLLLSAAELCSSGDGACAAMCAVTWGDQVRAGCQSWGQYATCTRSTRRRGNLGRATCSHAPAASLLKAAAMVEPGPAMLLRGHLPGGCLLPTSSKEVLPHASTACHASTNSTVTHVVGVTNLWPHAGVAAMLQPGSRHRCTAML